MFDSNPKMTTNLEPGPKEFVAARPFENVELSLPYPSAPVWGRAKATGTRTVRRNGLTLMGWGWGVWGERAYNPCPLVVERCSQVISRTRTTTAHRKREMRFKNGKNGNGTSRQEHCHNGTLWTVRTLVPICLPIRYFLP